MAKQQGLTEREKLATSVRATIEWNFGQICDAIRAAVPDASRAEALVRMVRKHGNDSIRVCENHLDFYNITRNHAAETINVQRVTARALAQGEK